MNNLAFDFIQKSSGCPKKIFQIHEEILYEKNIGLIAGFILMSFVLVSINGYAAESKNWLYQICGK